MLHRTRELLVRQRTMLINAIRGHCAEFGIIAPQGAHRAAELIEKIRREEIGDIPQLVQASLLTLADQLSAIAVQIHALERRLLAWHRQDQDSQRLATIPGVGLRSPLQCPTPSYSVRAGSSRPSWAWFRARTPPAARSGWVASPRWAIDICASCWWSEPHR